MKPNDKKAGVEATTDNILCTTDCEFACWTNGEDLQYVHACEDGFGQVTCEAISDFPGEGQTLADLEAQGERAMPRKPANESLVKTFKRCQEYEDRGAIGSPDIIRLVSSDSLFTTEYLFAYLQLPPIYDYMQSLK